MTGHLSKIYLLLVCFALLPASLVQAQSKSLAVISGDKNKSTQVLVEAVTDSLETSVSLADTELVAAVVNSAANKNLFNLSLAEAKNIGVGIGCSHYLVLRSENIRRSSFKKNVYYEAFVIAFLINARTGELTGWKHLGAEAETPAEADKALFSMFNTYIPDIPLAMQKSTAEDQKIDPSIYEINESSETGLRTPLPFRRFSPTSTELAQHLRIEAVVDIEVAIDEKGYITQTKIMRWAGFGLDEVVTETVRKMNFRPAILNKKAIPARFLLRYNFRIPDPVKDN
jgi:TonB family protein